MKKLELESKIYHEGTNLTIKRGVSWSLDECVYMPKIGIIHIETVVIRFFDICFYILEKHHDPEQRNYLTLCQKMRDLYENFQDEEIVTLVFFEMNHESVKSLNLLEDVK